MRLVIAEKPSVAMNLAKVLGAGARRDGYTEGSGWLADTILTLLRCPARGGTDFSAGLSEGRVYQACPTAVDFLNGGIRDPQGL